MTGVSPDGKTLVVTSTDNTLYAVNAGTGAHVWNINGVQGLVDYVTPPTFTQDSSALFVYLEEDDDQNQGITSVSVATGKQTIWNLSPNNLVGPVVRCPGSNTVYDLNDPSAESSAGLQEFNPLNGSSIGHEIHPDPNGTLPWSNSPVSFSTDCTIVYGHDCVDDGHGQGHFTAVDTKTRLSLWAVPIRCGNPSLPYQLPGPALSSDGNRIFTATGTPGPDYHRAYGGFFFAYDAHNGTLLWHFATKPDGGDDDNFSDDNFLDFAAAVSPDSTSVYASNSIGSIYAFNGANGKILWTFKCDGIPVSTPYPTPDGSKVVFASTAGTVYAVDATTGEQVWSYITGSTIESVNIGPAQHTAVLPYTRVTLSPDGKVVYVGDDDGYVHALSV